MRGHIVVYSLKTKELLSEALAGHKATMSGSVVLS